MEDLRARLVAVLERDWPSSYGGWVQIQELLRDRMDDMRGDPEASMEVAFRYCYPDPGMLSRFSLRPFSDVLMCHRPNR